MSKSPQKGEFMQNRRGN